MQIFDADARYPSFDHRISDVVVGIESLHLEGSPERLKNRQILSAITVSGEQELLAPYGNDANRSLGGVVVQGGCYVVKEMPEPIAIFKRMCHCDTQRALRSLARLFLLDLREK